MDQSINGLMKAYLKDYEIDSKGDATDFEKFANYCVFSARQPYQSFNVDEVHTGKPGDTGIDGIGILVNNVLVNSEEEIEEEAGNRGRTLNVTFVDYNNFSKKSGFTNNLKTFLKSKNFNVSDLSKEQPKIAQSIKSRKKTKTPLMRIRKKNVDVTKTVKDLDEQLSLLPGLFPSQSQNSVNKQLDNYVEVPSALTQIQLAKRLQVRRETIGNKKHMKNFAEWTQERDPDDIAWNYSQQTKCYQPQVSEDG